MSFKNIEDLIHLEKLDEDEIVTVLRSRYARDEIYVSINRNFLSQSVTDFNNFNFFKNKISTY